MTNPIANLATTIPAATEELELAKLAKRADYFGCTLSGDNDVGYKLTWRGIDSKRLDNLYEVSRAIDTFKDGRLHELFGDFYAQKLPPVESVNHPPHYNSLPVPIECIDVVEHMNFNRGNAIKYIWRAGEKGDPIQELAKAIWYLCREIERIKRFGAWTQDELDRADVKAQEFKSLFAEESE